MRFLIAFCFSFFILSVHAQEYKMRDHSEFNLPTFKLLSDFSKIKKDYNLVQFTPNIKFITKSNNYILKSELANIKLMEWNGKLHEINYDLQTTDQMQVDKIKKYLFDKYKGNNFEWQKETDNGFGKFYESTNNSVLGIYAYTAGITISFLSNESREEETKRRFPNLN